MNGRNLLIDSNIVIYLSKEILTVGSFTSDNDILFMSIITYMEVNGYAFTDDKQKNFIEGFCKRVNIIKLDDNIVDKTILIRQKNTIKLPDAIIAASSLIYNCTVATHNTADFINISPKIKLIDPMKE